jgi:hypothetical protein
MMERNAWGGPCIMVWGGIGLNVKLGPVIFQNLGPGRGNGITAARYIDQFLRPQVGSAIEMQQWLSSEKMTLRQSCRCNAH